MDYDAPDGQNVKLCFIIAAPKTGDNLHLQALAKLSTLLMLSLIHIYLLRELAAKYPLIVTVEENELIGGYGQMVSAFLHKNKYHNDLLSLGISDYFVRHATVAQQREQAGIDADSIVKSIIDRMN